MQLKHPEILWGLFLLVIPIIVHLFQLRRFKKTPFTNVAMLQKIMIDSQRANQLKKWLLLFTRLLLLASLIIAFAQPFTAKNQSFYVRPGSDPLLGVLIVKNRAIDMSTNRNGKSKVSLIG